MNKIMDKLSWVRRERGSERKGGGGEREREGDYKITLSQKSVIYFTNNYCQ
jgi:hypothetical protein